MLTLPFKGEGKEGHREGMMGKSVNNARDDMQHKITSQAIYDPETAGVTRAGVFFTEAVLFIQLNHNKETLLDVANSYDKFYQYVLLNS